MVANFGDEVDDSFVAGSRFGKIAGSEAAASHGDGEAVSHAESAFVAAAWRKSEKRVGLKVAFDYRDFFGNHWSLGEQA